MTVVIFDLIIDYLLRYSDFKLSKELLVDGCVRVLVIHHCCGTWKSRVFTVILGFVQLALLLDTVPS